MLPSVFCIVTDESKEDIMKNRFESSGLDVIYIKSVKQDNGIIQWYGNNNIRYASHMRALRSFIESGKLEGIICEDSMMIHNEFISRYVQYRKNIPDDYTVVTLSYEVYTWNMIWSGKDPSITNICKTHEDTLKGTYMYLISRKYAMDCLGVYDRPQTIFSIDEITHNGYAVYPILAILEPPTPIILQTSDQIRQWNKNWKDWGIQNFVTNVTLTELANKYGSDKGTICFHKHGYSKVYENIFKDMRFNELKMLEIGIQSISKEGKSSLSIWLEYFPKGHIYGFDIKPVYVKHTRASVMCGDQSKIEDLMKIPDNMDIIIDDGYHSSQCQQITFDVLFGRLKPGGIYIIEDLHYQPEQEDYTKGMIMTKTLLETMPEEYPYIKNWKYIKQHIDRMELYDSESPYFDSHIKKNALCIIWKTHKPTYVDSYDVQDGITSWDFFDTLVGRRCGHPHEIFKQVAHKTHMLDFFKHRYESERKTLDETYTCMEKYYSKEQCDMLKSIEWETELDNIFPIMENIKQVKDGDIIVSDTYFSEQQIRCIVDKINLNKRITVYTSYDGKRTGNIWNDITKSHNIKLHVGDNEHSDWNVPKQFGIKTKLYSSLPYDTSYHNLVRYLKLQNPYDGGIYKELWDIHSEYTIPIDIMLVSGLHNIISNKYKQSQINFCSRDCRWIMYLYNLFYPHDSTCYFATCRHILRNPTSTYTEYLKKHSHGVFVDLCGTGYSGDYLFNKMSASRIILWCFNTDRLEDRKITSLINDVSINNTSLEILHFDEVGPLKDVIDDVVIRDTPEYDIQLIQPIKTMLTLIRPDLNLHYDADLLIDLIRRTQQFESKLRHWFNT